MVFGWSKSFVIVLFLAILIGAGTNSYLNAFEVILGYVIITVIWRLLTQ